MRYVKFRKKNIFFKLAYNFLRSYERMKAVKIINNISKKYNNEVIFIDYPGSSSKYINKIKAKKKIYWGHSVISDKRVLKLKRINRRLSKYTNIVTICNGMKEEYEKFFPKLKNKIIKIYNFIDEKEINKKLLEKEKMSEYEKELLEKEYCVAVGRITNEKDYKTLIEAFILLKNRGIKEKLYIVGDGELRLELERLIKNKNLEEEIILLGAKSNPYIWMKNAKIFIHSSFAEGFGLVLIEAMHIGVPIISSNFKVSSYELVEKENNGEIFKIGDSKELSEKIEKLLKNENLRKEYTERAKEFVKKFYLENIIKDYEKIMNND